MLKLYQSNDLQALAQLFCEHSKSHVLEPMTAATVIVQSFGTGQWLKYALARNQGIAANLECILPAHFIWGLYQSLLGQDQHSSMDTATLRWRLLPLIQQQQSKEFESIQNYLALPGDKSLRGYQLADKIAGLYDQYLVYRPEWILAWENQQELVKNNPHPWQPILWRELMAGDPTLQQQHRARLHSDLMEKLVEPVDPLLLPGPISVFGLSTLPAMQLETICALASHIDIDVYFMNPCQHYWGDIVSEKDIAKRSIRRLIGKSEPLLEEDYLEIGNPLLASMGKLGREFLEMLLEAEGIQSFEAFIEPEHGGVLPFIQKDILNLEFGGEFADGPGQLVGNQRIPTGNNDDSLQIHSCHSQHREVEVLCDQLLNIFANHPEIKPTDIIVMAPDIVDYVPFIHSVFSDQIPFGITDRSLAQRSALIGSFIKMLGLADSRLTGSEVMDFLEVPAIARKFDLNEQKLSTIAHWIQEAGIRWEVDGARKAEKWNVPENNQNTWRFGLDRLTLGMAMDSSDGIYGTRLPLNLSSAEAELAGTLSHIIDILESLRQMLETDQSASIWQTTISATLTQLFEPDGDETMDISQIQSCLQELVDETRASKFEDAISGQLLRHWLSEKLNADTSSIGFITGGVTFATLVPMRSIPFKVICLLGMNDSQFPRQDQTLSFDLMNVDGARKGDRSRRTDDRYLFLEAILAARDIFYISYSGKAQKDNKEKPASVVVNDLLDYANQVFDHIKVIDHPLQPFSRRYYQQGELTSYQQHWYGALTKPADCQPFNDATLPPNDDLSLTDINQLSKFISHSGKYFMQQRLGVYFSSDEDELQDTESFALDGLEKYNLADSALTNMVKDKDIDRWQQEVIATGQIMDNVRGNALLETERAHAEIVFEAMQDYLAHASGKFTHTLNVAGKPLPGHINNLGEEYILNYRSGTLHKRHILELWVNHLFANAAGLEVATIAISRAKEKALVHQIQSLDSEQALHYLEDVINLYNQGTCQPVCFPPETVFSFQSSLIAGDDFDQAATKATKTWQAQNFSEAADPYWSRLFDLPEDINEHFAATSERLLTPLLHYFEELK